MTNTLYSRETMIEVLNDCAKHVNCGPRCDMATYKMIQAIVKPYSQILLKEKGLDYDVKVVYDGKVGYIVSAVSLFPFEEITFQYHTVKNYRGLDMIDEIFILSEKDLDKITLA